MIVLIAPVVESASSRCGRCRVRPSEAAVDGGLIRGSSSSGAQGGTSTMDSSRDDRRDAPTELTVLLPALVCVIEAELEPRLLFPSRVQVPTPPCLISVQRVFEGARCAGDSGSVGNEQELCKEPLLRLLV